MHIFSFLFFLSINNAKYPTNNCKSLILPNYKFSFTNSLSAYYSISVNLYIKKNLRLIPGFKLII